MRISVARPTIFLSLGAAVLGLLAYLVWILPMGELGEAKAWATLQGLEVKYRNDPDAQAPIILFDPIESSYVVLGIPTHDDKTSRVWVILNATTPRGSVYIMPKDHKYYLSCSYLSELASKTKILPEVLDLLKTNCV